jgi:hypothetical protein
MSFDDELKELILDAKADAERRHQELIQFRDDWQFKKTHIVKPVLDQSVTALKIYSAFDALTELRNGSIRLKMGPKSDPKQSVTYELIFSPIDENLEIQCTSRNTNLSPESFTLDSLDGSTVEGKVKEFVSAVLKG